MNSIQPESHVWLPPGGYPGPYAASGLSRDGGQHQKRAIIIDTFPNKSDLTTFSNNSDVPQSLSNITFIQAVPRALPAPSARRHWIRNSRVR